MYSVNLGLGSDSLVLHMRYCTPRFWDQGRIPCCHTSILYSMTLGPAEDFLLLHMLNVLREPGTRDRYLGLHMRYCTVLHEPGIRD
jgi:hypothetical protein